MKLKDIIWVCNLGKQEAHQVQFAVQDRYAERRP